MFGWCSWLSRQSNTLKVPSSILGSNSSFCTPEVSPDELLASWTAVAFLVSNGTGQKINQSYTCEIYGN